MTAEEFLDRLANLTAEERETLVAIDECEAILGGIDSLTGAENWETLLANDECEAVLGGIDSLNEAPEPLDCESWNPQSHTCD